MKKWIMAVASLWSLSSLAADPPDVKVTDLQVAGDIDGENVTFVLSLTADVARRGSSLVLVEGDVACLATKLPDDAKLSRDGNRLVVTFASRGKQRVELTFASLAGKDDAWRSSSFRIPQTSVRRLAMTCDRDDVEVQFPGALSVDRKKNAGGKTLATAFLGVGDSFQVRWKPVVKKLTAEASVECEASTIAAAGVGALRLDTLLTYTITQGELDKLSVEVPADLTITQVEGEDLLEWSVSGDAPAPRTLTAKLSRPRAQRYVLHLQAERALPPLPCAFALPVLRPLQVVRASGFLVVGADSAIKMVTTRMSGLTQVDPDAVPPRVDEASARLRPARSAYAYQYASMPYGLELTAEDIVTTIQVDSRFVLSAQDRDLVLTGDLELDVRDASARDVVLEIDPAWTITNIEGEHVADYDVRDEQGVRAARVYFRDAVLGKELVHVRVERSRGTNDNDFAAPVLHIRGARSERGHLVLAAEKGVRFSVANMENLREVPLASLPVRVPDAQLAFRFKSSDWKLGLRAVQAAGAVHSELFHLVSLGEGALYGSCSITYHVAGAPVRSLRLSIPASYQNIEFVGRDIRGWTHDGETWTVTFQEKVLGDYTLLVTYDQRLAAADAQILAGGIHAIDTESEVGYIALAGRAEFSVDEASNIDPSMIPLDETELPPAYALLVNDPVIKAWKYVRAPHAAQLRLRHVPTEALLAKVADHAVLETRISCEGERVTTATYFVKNTSDQFLGITLPKGARLWTANVDSEQVQVRQADGGDGRLLVPIRRNLDPNRPSRVELTYAETGAKLGLSTSIAMDAPFCAAQSVFVKWSVLAPDGFRLVGAGGNMLADVDPGLRGLAALIASFFRHAASVASGISFSKVVSLAGTDLHVQVRAAPAWIGATGSLTGFVLLAALSAILLAAARCSTSLHPWRVSLAATCAVAALSELELTRLLVARLFVPVVIVAVVVLAIVKWRRRSRTAAATGDDAPPLLRPSEAGGASIGLCMAVAIAAVLLAGLAARGDIRPVPPTPAPSVDNVTFDITVPTVNDPKDRIAQVHLALEFTADQPLQFRLLSRADVPTNVALHSSGLELRSDGGGYCVQVLRAGSYKVALDYLVPVSESRGTWSLPLHLPNALKNSLVLHLPDKGIDVQCDRAALLKTTEKDAGTEARIVLAPVEEATLTWRPKVRRTDLEQAVFYVEADVFAVCEPGGIQVSSRMHYQVAKGEIQTLRIHMPDNQAVSSVTAPGLSTWRFDPASHVVDAVLEKPASGDIDVTVIAQVPQERLPYDVKLLVPDVPAAARSRGTLAVAAPDSVQVEVGTAGGVEPMNIDDFPLQTFLHSAAMPGIKRAFRYQQTTANVAVTASAVLPEIRVQEQAGVDISDERTVLTSKLTLSISKAPLFSVRLLIPDDYDVESLTGQDVSHWDEFKDAGHFIEVHFARQALGERDLNVVLARSGKGIEASIAVPRVRVQNAAKQAGTLVVSGERGVRLSVAARDGVSEINPKDLGIAMPGYLAFKLLREDWSLGLATEVVPPGIRADVLQRVDLSEGVFSGHATFQFRIDDAGVKNFQFRAPRPGVTLTFQGRNIAQVREVDSSNGTWEVELHGKVQDQYTLDVSYQRPFNADDRTLRIAPVRAVGLDQQKGYLVVMAGDRIEVKPLAAAPGVQPEDARNIPHTFGGEDLSGAILCYRTPHSDAWIDVSLARHDTARTLSATITDVELTSVLSDDEQAVTRLTAALTARNVRFLKTVLPEDSHLWCVFVNGRSVQPLVEKGAVLIPLDAVSDASPSTLELIYAGRVARKGWLGRMVLDGPKLDMPLADIRWSLFVPPRYRYHDFGGTLNYQAGDNRWNVRTFDTSRYTASAEQDVTRNLQMAEDVLKKGSELARAGRQKEARKAFESAMYFSAGRVDMNEDTRIQYRNLAKQQAIVGLVNRRADLKRSWNVQDAAAVPAEQGFNAGQWTPEYGQQVARSLSDEESAGLNAVADKILDQQTAAEGAAPAIHLTMPLEGRELTFTRSLQVNPLADMTVSFRRSGAFSAAPWLSLLAGIALLLAIRGSLRFAR